MIIGISGSGRKDGVTYQAVKAVLEATQQEYEIISLSGKKISGCLGCTKCAKTNVCIVKDDFIPLAEKLVKADAIVFGAANYYGMMNSLSHTFLERCFCFRHQDHFALAGKLVVGVSTSYAADQQNDNVMNQLSTFIQSNHMVAVSKVSVPGYSQCFTCGYGIDCASGNIVKNHGYLDELMDCHYPKKFADQPQALLKTRVAGDLLGSMLKYRTTIQS